MQNNNINNFFNNDINNPFEIIQRERDDTDYSNNPNQTTFPVINDIKKCNQKIRELEAKFNVKLATSLENISNDVVVLLPKNKISQINLDGKVENVKYSLLEYCKNVKERLQKYKENFSNIVKKLDEFNKSESIKIFEEDWEDYVKEEVASRFFEEKFNIFQKVYDLFKERDFLVEYYIKFLNKIEKIEVEKTKEIDVTSFEDEFSKNLNLLYCYNKDFEKEVEKFIKKNAFITKYSEDYRKLTKKNDDVFLKISNNFEFDMGMWTETPLKLFWFEQEEGEVKRFNYPADYMVSEVYKSFELIKNILQDLIKKYELLKLKIYTPKFVREISVINNEFNNLAKDFNSASDLSINYFNKIKDRILKDEFKNAGEIDITTFKEDLEKRMNSIVARARNIENYIKEAPSNSLKDLSADFFIYNPTIFDSKKYRENEVEYLLKKITEKLNMPIVNIPSKIVFLLKKDQLPKNHKFEKEEKGRYFKIFASKYFNYLLTRLKQYAKKLNESINSWNNLVNKNREDVVKFSKEKFELSEKLKNICKNLNSVIDNFYVYLYDEVKNINPKKVNEFDLIFFENNFSKKLNSLYEGLSDFEKKLEEVKNIKKFLKNALSKNKQDYYYSLLNNLLKTRNNLKRNYDYLIKNSKKPEETNKEQFEVLIEKADDILRETPNYSNLIEGEFTKEAKEKLDEMEKEIKSCLKDISNFMDCLKVNKKAFMEDEGLFKNNTEFNLNTILIEDEFFSKEK